ncbi:MAG TPA: Hsp20/alpha crystallin family protein [Rariglobus sp.]|nr:Hsp20/alpha crystallin family protein [Rariglobus sp.]
MRIVRYNYPSYRSVVPSRSPWSGLEGEIDRLFNSALGDFAGSFAPDRFPVDLYEDQENTYVRAELPGIDRADLGVELVDGTLNIRATRKTSVGEKEESFTLNRSVRVPDAAVNTEKISAAYENGVLTVTLPKREEAKPRKVTVAVN